MFCQARLTARSRRTWNEMPSSSAPQPRSPARPQKTSTAFQIGSIKRYADGPGGVFPIYTRDREKAQGYWLHSVAARYQVDASTTLNLNVDNLFNKFYYSRIGASLDGFQLYGVPGTGRTVTASVDYNF